MEYNNLLELIKTVSESNISNFKYEEGDMKIHMSSGEVVADVHTINMVEQVANVETTVKETAAKETTVKETAAKETVAMPVTNTSDAAKISGKVVTSPLVGTFYVAPSEDSDPFVQVGDVVKTGQTLAIVEAMKLMNEIESEYDGKVVEVYVGNGEAVEYGQPLFAIA